VRGEVVVDENGRPIRLRGAAQDVTNQRDLELKLQRNQTLLTEAHRLAQIGVWEFDYETLAMTWSEELYDIFDIDPGTTPLTIETIFLRIHPEEQSYLVERWQRAMLEKSPYELSFRILRTDGEVRYLHSYNRPVVDANGEITRFYGTIQDETRKHRTAELIRRKAVQLAALNEMGQTVVSTRDLKTIFDNVLETTRALTGADCIFIFLRHTRQSFYLMAGRGPGTEKLIGKKLPANFGIAGEVVQQKQSLKISGTDEVRRRMHPKSLLTAFEPQEVLAAPLYSGDEVAGLIEALHTNPNYTFPADDLAILEVAATWTAVALTNARLYEEISRSEEKLRDLAEQMINNQEEERRRVSRELHDETGQSLTALKLSLDMLASELHDQPHLARQLNDARRLSEKTMQDVRNIAYDLRPPELDTIGLDAALRELCESFSRRTNIQVKYKGGYITDPLSDAIQLSFYRFLQEALTNVARHSQATQVRVTLLVEPYRLGLRVSDNGRGLDKTQVIRGQGAGLGLLGMEERFVRVGGALHINSKPGKGATLIAMVPRSALNTGAAPDAPRDTSRKKKNTLW
jgi:signal transduction histidine kinase